MYFLKSTEPLVFHRSLDMLLVVTVLDFFQTVSRLLQVLPVSLSGMFKSMYPFPYIFVLAKEF